MVDDPPPIERPTPDWSVRRHFAIAVRSANGRGFEADRTEAIRVTLAEARARGRIDRDVIAPAAARAAGERRSALRAAFLPDLSGRINGHRRGHIVTGFRGSAGFNLSLTGAAARRTHRLRRRGVDDGVV